MERATARLVDVARHANVSVMTVSNVVNDHPHVRPAMRARVLAAIDELGYRPNVAARRLVTGRTGTLAIALPEINVPYFAELARALADHARRLGYRVLIEQTIAGAEDEQAVLHERERGLVDGVVFHPVTLTSETLATLRPDLPLVLLGETRPPPEIDHVMIDNLAWARRATEHLIDLGRRRIGFLGMEPGVRTQTTEDRIGGQVAALAAAGLVSDLQIATSWYGADDGERALDEALAGGLLLDGLLCRDDMLALGAIRALRRHGLRVPDDVAVVGWDDVAVSAFTVPSLTSVSPDVHRLASTALDLLRSRIEGHRGPGRHELVPARLAVRESAPVTSTGG